MTNLPVRDSVSNYEKISRIGEGTYGVVCKTTSKALLCHSICYRSGEGCSAYRLTYPTIYCRQGQGQDHRRGRGSQEGQNGEGKGW